MKITSLQPNEVFVFGSNLAGRHGAGAARDARILFGAQHGVGEGMTGQCYALPTKDRRIQTLPLAQIQEYIRRFIAFAKANPDKKFLVTAVGCGYAGYTHAQIAPMFKAPPVNVALPEEFKKCIIQA